MKRTAAITNWFPPSPDSRSEGEIAADIADEIAFHLLMAQREVLASGEAEDEQSAAAMALRRFGSVENIKRECRRIALWERIMLQRINFVLMIIVVIAVVAVSVQMYLTQRYNSLALQAIVMEITEMKFDAQPMVLLEGSVAQPGRFPIDLSASPTVAQFLRKHSVEPQQFAKVEGVVRSASEYLDGEHGKTLLRDGQTIRVYDVNPFEQTPVLSPGVWIEAPEAEPGNSSKDRLSLMLRAADDLMNPLKETAATIAIRNSNGEREEYTLQFEDQGDVEIRRGALESQSIMQYKPKGRGRWRLDEEGALYIGLEPILPDRDEPVAFRHVTEAEAARVEAERLAATERARAEALSAFAREILTATDPETRQLILTTILEEAADTLESGALSDQPDAEAEIRKSIQDTIDHLLNPEDDDSTQGSIWMIPIGAWREVDADMSAPIDGGLEMLVRSPHDIMTDGLSTGRIQVAPGRQLLVNFGPDSLSLDAYPLIKPGEVKPPDWQFTDRKGRWSLTSDGRLLLNLQTVLPERREPVHFARVPVEETNSFTQSDEERDYARREQLEAVVSRGEMKLAQGALAQAPVIESIVQAAFTSLRDRMAESPPARDPEELPGVWREVSLSGETVENGLTLSIIRADDLMNIEQAPIATVTIEEAKVALQLLFHQFGTLRLSRAPLPGAGVLDAWPTADEHSKWRFTADGHLLLNLEPVLPHRHSPLIFERVAIAGG